MGTKTTHSLLPGSPARATRAASVPLLALVALVLVQPGPSVLAVTPPPAAFPPVEINPSIMVVGAYDWGDRCLDMVQRAAEAGGSVLNFVPTHYWRGSEGGKDKEEPVREFCYMDSSRSCVAFDAAALESFRAGMARCFTAAVRAGLGISVVPHLDDGAGRSGTWRNGLLFSPVLLDPLAAALAAAMADSSSTAEGAAGPGGKAGGGDEPHHQPPPVPVWFALQGEMSATVLRYPHEYTQLVAEMRARLLTALWERGVPAEQVGLSFNYNKFLSWSDKDPHTEDGNADEREAAEPAAGNQTQSAPAPAAAAGVDVAGLTRLFEEVDFVGVSAYGHLKPDFQPQDLDVSATTFFQEMRDTVGLDLASLLRRRGWGTNGTASTAVEFHYSEFGVGGGANGGGHRAARSPAAAAAAPYWGISGVYRPFTDPFSSSNNEMRQWRRSFYSRALDWLGAGAAVRLPPITAGGGGAAGGDGGGGGTAAEVARLPVQHCFLWSMGSWDVLGVYPESTATSGSNAGLAWGGFGGRLRGGAPSPAGGTYRDEDVVAAVTRHNAGVRLASSPAADNLPPVAK
ncbi:hypothetical protein HXX76_012553 [Chlamydomonas incerta]|uniref:Uncharacterized protein n=1 Tax=Chlamydomonas incerta TaxID=51695 RepID=A0A835SI09_CHLIN|nr:hypothetical protein HXX76_012553 [Chlamydomonas incerta]|eukprot:KAG2427359.1 hypothetical protein HXX76_012553 [Chlamydomonas incerta]